jgi:hypothetical protein
MAVAVKGEADTAVPEHLGDDLHVKLRAALTARDAGAQPVFN